MARRLASARISEIVTPGFSGFSNSRAGYTPQQREIIDTFRSEEFIKGKMDVVSGHLWDSVSLDAGELFSESIRLFNIPLGHHDQRGRRKTEVDTNMGQPCHLFAPEAFAIRRFLFTFSKTADECDLYSIAEGFVWRFWMGRKPYAGCPIISLQMADLPKAPIRICEYCRSVYVNESRCPGCGAAEFTLSQLGEAGRGFVLDLPRRSELVIQDSIYFEVTFEGEPYRLVAPLKLWCHFEGLHARGIQ